MLEEWQVYELRTVWSSLAQTLAASMLHDLISFRDPPIESVIFYEVWKAAESFLIETTDMKYTWTKLVIHPKVGIPLPLIPFLPPMTFLFLSQNHLRYIHLSHVGFKNREHCRFVDFSAESGQIQVLECGPNSFHTINNKSCICLLVSRISDIMKLRIPMGVLDRWLFSNVIDLAVFTWLHNQVLRILRYEMLH